VSRFHRAGTHVQGADECSACNQEGTFSWTLSEFAERHLPFFSTRQKADNSLKFGVHPPFRDGAVNSAKQGAVVCSFIMFALVLWTKDSGAWCTSDACTSQNVQVQRLCHPASPCTSLFRLVPYQARYLTAFAYFIYISSSYSNARLLQILFTT
jgi:hypothetical protein